jgi:monovalent cation:H+ antiporter-2, CPA2 family
MTAACTHLGSVEVTELPPALACEECQKIGAPWVHLRMCLTCGKVGCCDNSLFQHATKHFQETGHPLIRSAEPHENWAWCYVDEVPLAIPS